MERRSSYKIKLESFKLARLVFSRLEKFTVLMEFFMVSFKWNLFFELPWYYKWEWYYSSLSGRSPNTE